MKKLPASAMVSVDAYVAAHPHDLQKRLAQIRNLIRKAAPAAEESISYMMPAYKLDGPLVYFAQQKNHLGFYVMPSGVEAFRDVLSSYQLAKSAIQFPNDKPLPSKLITDIVKFRVAENKEKAARKKSTKKS
jgi:uncharacterized protein YdhG (YjbR/CyaY superfamily)